MTEAVMIFQTIVFTITLVVLIYQTKRLRGTIQVSTYTKIIDLLKELRLLRVQDPDLAKIYRMEVQGLSQIEIKYHFFNLIVLSILEICYVHMKEGLISKETWYFWRDKIRAIAQEESFRQMILRPSYKIVNPEFCKIVESIVREIEQEIASKNNNGSLPNMEQAK